MSHPLKSTFLGLLLGMAGNVVGFFLYGFVVSLTQGVSFRYFYENMFLGTDVFKSKVLTGALLVNVIMFYFVMRNGSDGLVRGIVIAILLTVMSIVYYYS